MSDRERDPIDTSLYQLGLEAAGAALFELDARGIILSTSPNVIDVLGYRAEDVVGRVFLDWLHEDDRAEFAERIERQRKSGQADTFRHRVRHDDGRWLWLETSSRWRASDSAPRLIAVSRDVTAALEAERALRASADRQRRLTENIPDLIIEIDLEGRFLQVTPNAERIFGIPAERLLGRTLFESELAGLVEQKQATRLLKIVGQQIRDGSLAGQATIQLRHPDGTWHWLDCMGRTYRALDGEVRALVVCRDVTERVSNIRQLRQSEERYRVVGEASRDIVTELDAEGRVVYVSPTLRDLLGMSADELIGSTPTPSIHPSDVDRLTQGLVHAVQTGETAHFERYRVKHRDGTWRWFEGSAIPYRTSEGEQHIIGLSRDVDARVSAENERLELERRMQQTQRLEGLGIMAGGIAHDFNNLLTPILGESSLALETLPADSPLREHLRAVQKAAHRAEALTRQMLAYAGTGPLVTEQLDLSHLVGEMGQLLESSVQGPARIEYQLPPALPAIEADSSQMSQVVMNLITNASEAIGDSAGRVVVSTGVTEGDYVPSGQTTIGDVASCRYVYCEVSDTGQGMDTQTQARIFDPFFTTKFTGRGLGLAAVLGIVRGHKGLIEIESTPGQGTRFRVLIPALAKAAEVVDNVFEGAEAWRGTGTVLVVDDDEGVLNVTRAALERAGLRVFGASNGLAGVELYREHAAEIELVLLDRTMPSMSGDRVFNEIRRIQPEARIVLVSGYSEEQAAEGFAGGALAGFLQKPFLPTELIALVRQHLRDQGQPGPGSD